MSQWDRLNPEHGDQEGLATLAQRLMSQAEEWDARRFDLQRVAGDVPAHGVWEGAAANALHEGIAAVLPDLEHPAQACRETATGVRVYDYGLSEIETEARKLRVMTADHQDVMSQLAAGAADPEIDMASAAMTNLAGQAEVLFRRIEAGWDELSQTRTNTDKAFEEVLASAKALLVVKPHPILAGMAVFTKLPGQIGLNDITAMNATQLSTWLTNPANKTQLYDLLSKQGYNPADTAKWWAKLGQTVDPKTGKVTVGETQQLLINAYPEIIGNLQGVSYTARDKANQTILTKMKKELDTYVRDLAKGLNPVGPAWLDKPGYVDRIQKLWEAMKPGQSGGVKQLISLNLDQPGAAISVGDLDAAKVTTYQIPGVDTTVAKSMLSLTQAADTQYRQQYGAAKDATIPTKAGVPPRLAVVGWLAFEPAPAIAVFDDSNAQTGGDFLSKDLKALAAVQSNLGNSASNNISALSYGTLTAQAAAVQGLPVDSINLNADIGVLHGVTGVKDFHLNPGAEVYRTKFATDNVAEIGNQGRDHIEGTHYRTVQLPSGPSFSVPVPSYGATQIGAEGTPSSSSGPARLPTENHGWLQSGGNLGYASYNTESSINQANVSLGLTDKLTNSGKPVVDHE